MDCWDGGAGVGNFCIQVLAGCFFSRDHSPVHEHRWRDSSFRQYYREHQQQHQTSGVVGDGHIFKSPALHRGLVPTGLSLIFSWVSWQAYELKQAQDCLVELQKRQQNQSEDVLRIAKLLTRTQSRK
jgi:ribulose bisphosphate carboxylase small subunit